MTDHTTHVNIFLADENVFGPAVALATSWGVTIIRDQDLDVETVRAHCPPRTLYDICLFQYAMAMGYVLVTANVKDFEWQYYEYAETHETPGIVFIRDKYHRSAHEIATWLALWSDEDLKNRLLYLPPQ